MTTQQLLDYYVDLLIKQYHGKPKARATIETLVSMPLMIQGESLVIDLTQQEVIDLNGEIIISDSLGPILPVAVQDAFDLDTAVGAQLDLLGKYAGVSRTGPVFEGNIVTFDDADYRVLVKAVVARNALKADLNSIQTFLFTFFPGVIQTFDHLGMRMSFFYLVEKGTNLGAERFILTGNLPRPLAVGAAVIYAFPTNHFFGFRTYEAPAPSFVAPFNDYSSYQMDWPWLSYSDIILI